MTVEKKNQTFLQAPEGAQRRLKKIAANLGLLLFGVFARDLGSALVIALAIGVFLFGSMVGLYAATPMLYPAAIRATGMGWAIGIGRIGAIMAPVTAGLLVDRGWDSAYLYGAFALPLAAAVLTVRALRI